MVDTRLTGNEGVHAGHDLVGSIAWNEEALDSAASYCRVPMSSSLDLASHIRQDGIQYRVGIHQVLSPSTGEPCRPASVLEH